MRTTVTINDDLFNAALAVAGEQKPSQVIASALKAYVAQKSAQRLIALQGVSPDFFVPRRSIRSMVADKGEGDYGSA